MGTGTGAMGDSPPPPSAFGRAGRRPALVARVGLLLAILLLGVRPAAAQRLTRPHLDWRTLETTHFTFHYPAAMATWTRDVAARMEAVHEVVTRVVGHVPDRKVRVLVEDPSNAANGFALPFRDAPTIFLWPTPPDPSGVLAHNRGWGELLAVHEFAHIAHLARPSRNPRQRRLWALLPVELGPITRRAPRWVVEGYATYVEGLVTGSGRPASVSRAAILRQWALEGQLPTYGELNGSGRFLGGSMAYLAGSAYLEWLVAREGEESLTHLWRRMTARADRGFNEAFVGVYGAPPAELYGRFTAELTARAMDVADSLAARGANEGELVQRLGSATGAPALSPDGSRIAIVLRSTNQPPRLVIWSLEPDTAALAASARARDRQRELDPEDVPAVSRRPRPLRVLHTLHPVAGRSHEQPRFLPDGQSLLVVRSVAQGDGTERPDLFEWRPGDGTLRRVTLGASVRDADPAPDGRGAASVRCVNGICDLVYVALEDGAIRVLASGSPSRSFYRPRWSPDGGAVLVSLHEQGRWRLALVPAAGGKPRFVDPDDGVSRYAADFLPGGAEVVATSERGGLAQLERLELATGRSRPLTRGTGAHLAADATADGAWVYFLDLHARGYDVRRASPDSLLREPLPAFAGAFWPAVPPTSPFVADTLAAVELPPGQPYGLGPRAMRLLPGVTLAPEGRSVLGLLHGTDPVGRLSWLLQGAFGERGTWQGASLSGELRTTRPLLRADLFATRHRPSTGREGEVAAGVVGAGLDADYAGAAVGLHDERQYGAAGYAARVAVSHGHLEPAASDDPATPTPAAGTRTAVHAAVAGAVRWQRGRDALTQGLRVSASTGSTLGTRWTRTLLGADATLLWRGQSVRGFANLGLTDADAPLYERFTVGGVRSPLVPDALLDQRWSMPALPPAVAVGSRLLAFRAETDLFGSVIYAAGAAAGDSFGGPWHRVVGIEQQLTFAPIPFAAVPEARILGGLAHSLDAPFAHRTRLYLSVAFQP